MLNNNLFEISKDILFFRENCKIYKIFLQEKKEKEIFLFFGVGFYKDLYLFFKIILISLIVPKTIV
jgi:hypothetical protein